MAGIRMRTKPTHFAQPSRTGAASCYAFSLIEVTLTLMVVSIGILSVMSLFGTGLEQNARSTDHTYVTLFAEEVMSGMRAKADQAWGNLASNAVMQMAFAEAWNPALQEVKADGRIRTNMLCNAVNTNILQASYRYRLRITTNEADTVKGISLEVWNSHFGQVSISNAYIFYTEVINVLH